MLYIVVELRCRDERVDEDRRTSRTTTGRQQDVDHKPTQDFTRSPYHGHVTYHNAITMHLILSIMFARRLLCAL